MLKMMRIVSIMLALLMLISAVPMTAFASQTEPPVTITSMEFTTNGISPVVNGPMIEPVPYKVNGSEELVSLIEQTDLLNYRSTAYSTDTSDYEYEMTVDHYDGGWAYELIFDIYCTDDAVFDEDCTLTLKLPTGDVSCKFYDKYDDTNIGFGTYFDLTGGTPVRRMYGDNRYETAFNILESEPMPSMIIVLASGENYPDALAGTILADDIGAPILLSPKDELDDAFLERLGNLWHSDIIILGGTGAISQNVEDQLEYNGYSVRRIYGDNRNATAAKIAAELSSDCGEAFLVSNENFADALSAGSAASLMDAPILYVNPDGTLPDETKQALIDMECKKTYIIGGEAAIAADAETELTALNIQSERVYGNDRQQTSIKVYDRFKHLFTSDNIAIATGKNYPDALAGVALAAYLEMPVFLTVDSAPAELVDLCKDNKPEYLFVFGGRGVVSDSVVDDLC